MLLLRFFSFFLLGLPLNHYLLLKTSQRAKSQFKKQIMSTRLRKICGGIVHVVMTINNNYARDNISIRLPFDLKNGRVFMLLAVFN